MLTKKFTNPNNLNYLQYLNSFTPEERLHYENESWLYNTSHLSSKEIKHDDIHQAINHRGIMEGNHLLVRNNMLEQLGLLKVTKKYDNSVSYTYRLMTREDSGKITQLKRNLKKQYPNKTFN